jgi:hypothetical protein
MSLLVKQRKQVEYTEDDSETRTKFMGLCIKCGDKLDYYGGYYLENKLPVLAESVFRLKTKIRFVSDRSRTPSERAVLL